MRILSYADLPELTAEESIEMAYRDGYKCGWRVLIIYP